VSYRNTAIRANQAQPRPGRIEWPSIGSLIGYAVPPAPGIYNVYVTSPSLRLTYTRVLAFEATEVK